MYTSGDIYGGVFPLLLSLSPIENIMTFPAFSMRENPIESTVAFSSLYNEKVFESLHALSVIVSVKPRLPQTWKSGNNQEN